MFETCTKKGLSALLALCLMLSLLPYAAFAQGTQEKKLVIEIPNETYQFESLVPLYNIQKLGTKVKDERNTLVSDTASNIEFDIEFQKVGDQNFTPLGTKGFKNPTIEFHAGTYRITAKGKANTEYEGLVSKPAQFIVTPMNVEAQLPSGTKITKVYDGTNAVSNNNEIILIFAHNIFTGLPNHVKSAKLTNPTYESSDVGQGINIGGELELVLDSDSYQDIEVDISKITGDITPKPIEENMIDVTGLTVIKTYDKTAKKGNGRIEGTAKINNTGIALGTPEIVSFSSSDVGDDHSATVRFKKSENSNYKIDNPIDVQNVRAKITKADMNFNQALEAYKIKEGEELPVQKILDFFKDKKAVGVGGEQIPFKAALFQEAEANTEVTDAWIKQLKPGIHNIYVKLSASENYNTNYNDLVLPQSIKLTVEGKNANNQNQGQNQNPNNKGGGNSNTHHEGNTGNGGTISNHKPQVQDTAKVKTEEKNSIASVKAEVKKTDKKASATLQDKAVEEAVKALEKEVRAKGTKAQIEIKLDTASNTEELSLNLSKKAVEQLVQAKVEVLSVDSDFGSVSLDQKALESVSKQAQSKNLSLNIAKAETKLNEKQKQAVGEAPVYNITLLSGGKEVKNFDGGRLTIELPYTLKTGEMPNKVAVWYVDDMGNIEKMEAMYNVKTKTVIFTTTHLSKYVIVHENWKNGFKDVKETDWFYPAVKYIGERDLMKGVGADSFGPDEMTSRAMFVTILHRMEGRPAAPEMFSFKDVEAGKYYADAVGWAAANGIVKGIGNDTFAPDMRITREQAAFMLQNYALYKKMELGDGDELTEFEDRDAISPWALNALKWAVAQNVMTGKSETVLAPQAPATRAELAQILMNFMEIGKIELY